jgi:hypothetical protein
MGYDKENQKSNSVMISYPLAQLIAKGMAIASLLCVCLWVCSCVSVSLTAYRQDLRRTVAQSIPIFHILLWHYKWKNLFIFKSTGEIFLVILCYFRFSNLRNFMYELMILPTG